MLPLCSKGLLILLILIWFVYEMWHHHSQLCSMNSLSRHIVKSQGWMRALYGWILLLWLVISIIHLAQSNPTRIPSGIAITVMGLLFLDLFFMYNANGNIDQQFRKYHYISLFFVFILLLLLLFFGTTKEQRSSLWWVGISTLLLFSILFAVFYAIHPKDLDTSGCGIAIVEFLLLILLVLLFPL
jgi:hypothetical protein